MHTGCYGNMMRACLFLTERYIYSIFHKNGRFGIGLSMTCHVWLYSKLIYFYNIQLIYYYFLCLFQTLHTFIKKYNLSK